MPHEFTPNEEEPQTQAAGQRGKLPPGKKIGAGTLDPNLTPLVNPILDAFPPRMRRGIALVLLIFVVAGFLIWLFRILPHFI
ncbi:MAG: hypothetical protein ACRD50_07290 [Candidatus Acidiferrales bacterium]